MCSLWVLCCVCGALGYFVPAHRCAGLVCCVACAVSWATWLLFSGVHTRHVVLCVRLFLVTWLLFTGVLARCVALRVQSPGQLGCCSPACLLGALSCVCGVRYHLAPVQQCACSLRCVACAFSWATWLLFTSLHTGVWCCVSGDLSHLVPVHGCACSACFVACAVSWAAWPLFTGVYAPCVVFRVRCPGPPGSCSPVCWVNALCCVCGVLGHLAPVRRCARSVRCVACAMYWFTWLLFSDVLARCVVLRVRCPGPLGSCSPVRSLSAGCCVCGILGHLAPVHRIARLVRCVACAVSWANCFLSTGLPARCSAMCVPCPGLLGSCSPVCSLEALCCVCGAPGYLGPVHRCANSVCRVACAVSRTTWLLFTGVVYPMGYWTDSFYGEQFAKHNTNSVDHSLKSSKSFMISPYREP